MTDSEDWSGAWRPIVGPSNAELIDILGIRTTQIKAALAELVNGGLIVPTGSGRRCVVRGGSRRGDRRITYAVGFDLSPLALRYDELRQIGKIRRGDTRARKQINRELVRLADDCCLVADNQSQRDEIADMKIRGRSGDADEARRTFYRLKAKLVELEAALDDGRETDPERSEICSDILPTTPQILNDSVEDKRSPCGASISAASNDATSRAREREAMRSVALPAERAVFAAGLRPAELLELVPELTAFMEPGLARWPTVHAAAGLLSASLGVSRYAWGQACLTMGRTGAAVAVALMASRADEHFVSTRGGYFGGMLAAAEGGTLNLTPSIFGLRARKSP